MGEEHKRGNRREGGREEEKGGKTLGIKPFPAPREPLPACLWETGPYPGRKDLIPKPPNLSPPSSPSLSHSPSCAHALCCWGTVVSQLQGFVLLLGTCSGDWSVQREEHKDLRVYVSQRQRCIKMYPAWEKTYLSCCITAKRTDEEREKESRGGERLNNTEMRRWSWLKSSSLQCCSKCLIKPLDFGIKFCRNPSRATPLNKHNVILCLWLQNLSSVPSSVSAVNASLAPFISNKPLN